MFGYVRPLKPELLVREFSRYKSIYCGICKQIGHDYGQLPRLALGYDLTLLAVLLLSIAESQPQEDLEGCILNPLVRKPIARGGAILELCAGLSVLLAWQKARDDVRDGQAPRGLLLQGALYRAWRKTRKRYPEYERIIADELAVLHRKEQGEPDPGAGEVFGHLLERIFYQASALAADDPEIRSGIGLFGRYLGNWIYCLDAIDDLADDCNNENWNPYRRFPPEEARATATAALQDLEMAMDRTAALFPYRRDSGLLANIVLQGLPAVREQVMCGERLKRL